LCCKPHSLKITDFRFGTTSDGIRTVELLGLNTDKIQKLSFGCTNLRQDFVGANVWHENPSDAFCGVKIIYFYIREHLPAGYNDRLFLRRASGKVRRERLKVGDKREAGVGEAYHFGKNYCNLLCKQLAVRVKLDNPMKQTGRSKRRTAVTLMASKLPGGMLREASRHRSAETNARYQTETDESRMARATVFHYNAPGQQSASTPSPPVQNTTAMVMCQQAASTCAPVQQQLAFHYPQGNVMQQPRPAPVQYTVPMGTQYPGIAPPLHQVLPGATVFPGNVAMYQQRYPGNTPQGPPHSNFHGMGYFQQQP
jgi:hypothetical protein